MGGGRHAAVWDYYTVTRQLQVQREVWRQNSRRRRRHIHTPRGQQPSHLHNPRGCAPAIFSARSRCARCCECKSPLASAPRFTARRPPSRRWQRANTARSSPSDLPRGRRESQRPPASDLVLCVRAQLVSRRPQLARGVAVRRADAQGGGRRVGEHGGVVTHRSSYYRHPPISPKFY